MRRTTTPRTPPKTTPRTPTTPTTRTTATAPPTRTRSRTARLVLAPDAPAELEAIVRAVLADDRALDATTALVPPGLHSRVVLVEVGGRRFALKQYAPPLVLAVRTLLRRSRARREFEALEELSRLVPDPVRPVAWGERRLFGIVRRSVLVTELADGAIDLKTWRLAWGRGERPVEERSRLERALPDLARLVRAMHDSGFFAANAFHKNVLWRPDREGPGAFAFVDLPFATRGHAPLDEGRRVYDLACLDKDARTVLRSSVRLGFYRAYAAKKALDASDRRVLASVARERARREHSTWIARLERAWKKRWKRTRAAKLLLGRDPDARHRSSRGS